LPWPLPDCPEALLRLAKGYPYEAPERSYLFKNGDAHALPESGAERQALLDGRTPVIAHGSNRAPEQLRRKYGTESALPVTRAWLSDYDIVYSAHVTRYGAIAANLHHVPGTEAALCVTWLDAAQLERMHETELGAETYVYGALEGVALSLAAEFDVVLPRAYVYISKRGCLSDGIAPVALAAWPSRNRAHQARSQEEVQHLVRQRFRPDLPLEELILQNIREAPARRRLITEMMADAVPTEAPHFAAT
jgi:hypothetical protein